MPAPHQSKLNWRGWWNLGTSARFIHVHRGYDHLINVSLQVPQGLWVVRTTAPGQVVSSSTRKIFIKASMNEWLKHTAHIWVNSPSTWQCFEVFTRPCLNSSVLEGGVRSRIQGTYLLLVVKDRGIMGNGEWNKVAMVAWNMRRQGQLKVHAISQRIRLSLILQESFSARHSCRWRKLRSPTWTRTWRTCLSYYCL